MGPKIPGVIYLSGDIHRCQLDVRPASETGGYPLYEVTSSGIANSKTQGFATLEFDTTARDPSVRIKIIHGDATTRLDRTLRLSELQVPLKSRCSVICTWPSVRTAMLQSCTDCVAAIHP